MAICSSGVPNRRKLRAPAWVAFAKALDIYLYHIVFSPTDGFWMGTCHGKFVAFQSWGRVGISSMVALPYPSIMFSLYVSDWLIVCANLWVWLLLENLVSAAQ